MSEFEVTDEHRARARRQLAEERPGEQIADERVEVRAFNLAEDEAYYE